MDTFAEITCLKRMCKNAQIIIYCLLSFHMIFSQNNERNREVIKVLTFNILHGATTKGDFDLDLISKVIIDAKPDLVALQEVDFKTNRSRRYDIITEIGHRTKMISIFAKAMPYDGGEYGIGILSKYSFLKSENIALPYTKGKEPRTALRIILELPSSKKIAFISTHLDHSSDEKDRISQAKKINEMFTQKNTPTILAGDLNAVPSSTPINILERVWKSSYNKYDVKYTYPSSNPTKKLDYIMCYPPKKWRIIETKVIKNSIASDHFAYMAIIELLGNEK